MKKLIFTATLPIAFIISPPLAFTDEKMDEIKDIRNTPTQIIEIPSNWIENPQTTIENDGINSVPINTIDEGWEDSDQYFTEFRVCG